jgi:hypothetical protein
LTPSTPSSIPSSNIVKININQSLFACFNFYPSLIAKFSIKNLLTLVVENTFSEMRSGATDMPLQLEFDYRAIKERLKGQYSTRFAYFTAPKLHQNHLNQLQGFTQVTYSKGTQAICEASE